MVKFKYVWLVLVLAGLVNAETITECVVNPRAVEPGETITFETVIANKYPNKNTTYINLTNVNGITSYEMNWDYSIGTTYGFDYELDTSALSGVYWVECSSTFPDGDKMDGGSIRIGTTFDCMDDYGLLGEFGDFADSPNDIYGFNLTGLDTYVTATASNVVVERANGLTIHNTMYDDSNSEIWIKVNATHDGDAGDDTYYVYIKDFADVNSYTQNTIDPNVNVTPLTDTNFTFNNNVFLVNYKHEASNTDYWCSNPVTDWDLLVKCDNYAPYLNDLCNINESTVLVTPRERAALRTDVNNDAHVRELIGLPGVNNFSFHLLTSPFTMNEVDFFLTDFTGRYTDPDIYVKKHVSNGLEDMFSKRFDVDNYVKNVQLMPFHSYQVFVRNDTRETSLGYIVAEENRSDPYPIRLSITQPKITDYNRKCDDVTLGITLDCDAPETGCFYNSTGGNVSLGQLFIYNTTKKNYTIEYNSSSQAADASFTWPIGNDNVSWYVVCEVDHDTCGHLEMGQSIYCGDPGTSSAFNQTGLPDELLGSTPSRWLKFVSYIMIIMISLAVGGASRLGLGMAATTGALGFFQIFGWIPLTDVPYALTTLLAALTMFMLVFEKRSEVND